MKNAEVAKKFVEGIGEPKGSHLFVAGRTIYSYGAHFPIAIRLNNNIFLFNADGYSVTTSRHKFLVKKAIGNNEIHELDLNKINRVINKGFNDIKEVMADVIIEDNE